MRKRSPGALRDPRAYRLVLSGLGTAVLLCAGRAAGQPMGHPLSQPDKAPPRWALLSTEGPLLPAVLLLLAGVVLAAGIGLAWFRAKRPSREKRRPHTGPGE